MDEVLRLRHEYNRLQAACRALEEALLETGPFVKGSLVRRFSVCGKASCRCQRGEKHGPFWYLSRSAGGRTRLHYLGRAKADLVVARVEAYGRWRRLRQRVRQVHREMEAVLDRLGAVLAAAGEGGVAAWRTPSGTRIRTAPGALSWQGNRPR